MGRAVLLLLGLVSVVLGVARADDKVDVGGTPLVLVDADGYCRLSDQDPKQHAALLKMREIQDAATNQLVAWYLRCAALEAEKQGGVPDTSEYFQILVNGVRGAVRPLSLSRGDYIEEAVKQLGGVDVDKTRDMLQSRIGGAGLDIQIGQVKSLGVIHKDQNAAYTAILQRASSGQGDAYIAGVIGVTLINGLPVNVDFFSRFADQSTIDGLLKADRDYLDRLVAVNDSGQSSAAPPATAAAAEPAHSGIGWGDVLRVGVIGALLAGAIALTVRIFRKPRN